MYRYALQLRIPGIYLPIYSWLLTAVDKLSTHVGFWVHVKIASRIVSHITTLWHIVSFGCCTTNHSLVSNSVESCDIRKWVASGAIPRANTSKQQWRVSVGNFSRCFFQVGLVVGIVMSKYRDICFFARHIVLVQEVHRLPCISKRNFVLFQHLRCNCHYRHIFWLFWCFVIIVWVRCC